ncbi:MAG: hypothetical protein Q9219_005995 [cf. Caloplaca sp. 3 TL-2023]
MADQQATLTLAKSLCSPYGININVPAIAAADTAGSSSAAPAAAPAATASTPTGTAEASGNDMNSADSADTPDDVTSAAAASSTDTLTAPVSPSDFSTSSAAVTAAPTSAPVASDDGGITSTTGGSSLLVYDTKSVVPSATIAYSSLPTDASDANAQMATSSASYRANATANTTVAASSPIPFVGAAVRSKVQGLGIAMAAVMGVFCGL